jgi:peptide chain release factor 1
MRALAEGDYKTLSKTLQDMLKETFPSLLIPPSTTMHLSALMELKSAVGGSESSLFLSSLLRMYLRLANNERWKAVLVSKNGTDEGGLKAAVVEFKGEGAYDALRWESGVHRVQRVPATEAQGRVHTSTVAVIVSSSGVSIPLS